MQRDVVGGHPRGSAQARRTGTTAGGFTCEFTYSAKASSRTPGLAEKAVSRSKISVRCAGVSTEGPAAAAEAPNICSYPGIAGGGPPVNGACAPINPISSQ